MAPGELLGRASAIAIRRRLGAGELSCADVARELLQAIDDDPVGAWVTVSAELVLERAAELDGLSTSQKQALPMFGVPVAIKDNFDTADLPTAYGSPIYTGHVPHADAAAVGAFRRAGALIAGKVTCAEFAFMTPPPGTLNPLDASRTPGGSSTGSAAAVAAGTVPLATGTQTAGSINRPASYCGILGYKPTFGTFDRRGVKQLSATLDTVGLLGRAIDDLRLAAHALGGLPRDPDPTTRPTLGFARTELWSQVEAEAATAIDAWATERGLTEVELPGYAEVATAQQTIQLYETARSLQPEYSRHRDELSLELVDALERGSAIADDDYERAFGAIAAHAQRLLDRLAAFDAVLTPSATGVPPVGLAFTGDPLFCRVWTLLGAPSLSIPVITTTQQLPVAVQLVAAPEHDAGLLRAAEVIW